MPLHTVTVELEIVTPLFLSGADQATAELRVPSFRGALRYWLRALLGASDADPQQVFQEEEKVFGSTSRASPVALRLTHSPCKPVAWNEPRDKKGTAYLWFSLKENDQRPARRYVFYKSKKPFSLTLQSRNEEALQKTLCALWLLCNLGGLGARSRRCAGSLRIRKIDQPDLIPGCIFASQAGTLQELQNDMKRGIEAIWATGLFSQSGTLTSRPSFDILHPKHSHITISEQTWDSWEKAVDAVGETYKHFCSNRPTESTAIKNTLLSRQPLPTTGLPRAGLGLPIQYYYKGEPKGQQKGTITGKKDGADVVYERRASPLHMHITRLHGGTYTAVFTWFAAEFLPTGSSLQLEPENPARMGSGRTSIPSCDIARDAVKAIVGKNTLEVRP